MGLFTTTVVQPTVVREVNRGPTHVHHHRAPTDESVRLLREMEEKSKAEIIKAIKLEKNGFEAVIHVMKHFEDQTIEFRSLFSLNGKRFTVITKVSNTSTVDETVEQIRDDISKEIATYIMECSSKNLYEGFKDLCP